MNNSANNKSSHHLLTRMSFQPCIFFLLLWNPQGYFRQCVWASVLHTRNLHCHCDIDLHCHARKMDKKYIHLWCILVLVLSLTAYNQQIIICFFGLLFNIQIKSIQNKINTSCNLKASRWIRISRKKKTIFSTAISTFTHRLAKQIRVEWDDR